MKLIKTHDGMIGLQIKGKMIWCASMEEAVKIASAQFHQDMTEQEMARDISYAIDCMNTTGHTTAEFGIFGSFICTKAESIEQF